MTRLAAIVWCGLLTCRCLAQPALTSAEFSAGGIAARWEARRGLTITYGGVEAFRPYPGEFTVHNRAWTVAHYSMARGQSKGTLSRQDEAQVLTTEDSSQHFSYTKAVTLRPKGSAMVEFEYSQKGLDDAHLQLGWLPSVPWLSAAAYEVTDQGNVHKGRMTKGHSGKRVLWSGLSEMTFSSIMGEFTLKTSRPMTLYDYRNKGSFWLGWDHELKPGKVYRERVEVAFKPFSGQVAGIKVKELRWTRQVADGYFALSAVLARAPGGRQAVRLALRGADGERSLGEAVAQVELSAEGKAVELRLPVPKPGEFTGSLGFVDIADGSQLHSLGPLPFTVAPTLRFFSSLSLYTDEPTIDLIAEIPEAVPLAGLTLSCQEGSKPARTMRIDNRRAVLSMPIASFTDGLHRVTARLLNGKDVIGSACTRFCKAKPKPNAVKIDRRTGGLIVDGKPFFPFGFYTHKGRFYDDPVAPRQVLDMEAAFKFNLICAYHNFDVAFRKAKRGEITKFLDRADAVGLKVHYDIRQMCCAKPSEETAAQIADDVAAHRDAPALLCWYLADEPAGQRIPPEQFLELYPRLKALDPYHPTTMVFCVPKRAHEYLEGLDILMVDPYPIPNAPVTRVADTVDLVRRAAGPGVPIWCVPQAFGGGEGWGREPTPREERCMTYLAIVHGATGIHYFIRRPPMNNPFVGALWGEIRAMASEIRELAPVLLSPEPECAVEAVPADPALHLMGKRFKGEAYVFCVNTQKRPRQITVQCQAAPCEPTAQALFEDRSVAISSDGRIDDIIDGLGVRVYSYRLSPSKTPLPVQPNLLKNGDMEAQTNVGYPDYFHFGQGKDLAASWGTDSLHARLGRHSLFIRCPTAGQGPRVISYPMLLGPGRYRTKVFLKADRPDFSCRLAVSGGKSPASLACQVGPSWRAYSLDFEGPDKRRRVHLSLHPQSCGVLWADAMGVAEVK